jgi:hypothetical protein
MRVDIGSSGEIYTSDVEGTIIKQVGEAAKNLLALAAGIPIVGSRYSRKRIDACDSSQPGYATSPVDGRAMRRGRTRPSAVRIRDPPGGPRTDVAVRAGRR